jgi:hypothetical protein
LRTKMLQIEKTIRNYQQMIEEVKAMWEISIYY